MLADYYHRTRARAEEDFHEQQLSSQNQEQRPDAQQAAVISEKFKRSTADREAISTLGGQLAGKSGALQNLRRLIDDSLPGFQARKNLILAAPASNPSAPAGPIVVPVPVGPKNVVTVGGTEVIEITNDRPGRPGGQRPGGRPGRGVQPPPGGVRPRVNPPQGVKVPQHVVPLRETGGQTRNPQPQAGVRGIPVRNGRMPEPVAPPANQRRKVATRR